MKKIALVALLSFIIGLVYGNTSAGGPEPEFIEVPKTKVIHDPAPPPEQVPYFPDTCSKAVDYTEDIVRAAERFYNSGDDQLKIISDGRLYAINGQNTTELEERQRRLQGRTIGTLLNLEELLTDYQSAYERCKEDRD